MTPLHKALDFNGDFAVVKPLLELGADIRIPNSEGWNALAFSVLPSQLKFAYCPGSVLRNFLMENMIESNQRIMASSVYYRRQNNLPDVKAMLHDVINKPRTEMIILPHGMNRLHLASSSSSEDPLLSRVFHVEQTPVGGPHQTPSANPPLHLAARSRGNDLARRYVGFF